ncbi:MAG: NAD-dependent epimerase/dehydratase family protein [Chloroflexi bacterium]|nr:NAD-dependent epimerase/dehydratase family protein [Chloroflexota bacterium]
MILVTGANGFLGSWIVRMLVDRGHTVRAFVRPHGDLRNLDSCRNRIEIAMGDILQPDTLAQALEGCDAVVHSAGSIRTRQRESQEAWEMHFTGTANVLAAVRKAGLNRIVYTASIFTLGSGLKDSPADEMNSHPFAPHAFRYWQAKTAAQILAEKECAHGLPIVFVYPTFCFGPGDLHLSSAGQLVSYLRGRLPMITNTGLNVVDVRDAALGHVLALERGRVGDKYLLAGENVAFQVFFPRAGRMAGRLYATTVVPSALLPPVAWFAERLMHDPPIDYATAQITRRYWYYASAKAANELGFGSRPLDETLRDAIMWFREQKMI